MIIPDLIKFGIRVSTTFRLEIPATVQETITVDGLTAEQIAGGVTKSTAGLGTLQNYSLKGSWTSGDTTSPTVYASPAAMSGFFDDYYASLFGSATNGQSVFVDPTQTPLKAEVAPTVYNNIGPVTTTAELDSSKLVGAQEYLFDTTNQILYRKVNSVYTAQPASEIPHVIKPNRFYYNRATNKLFYAETSNSLVKF